MLMVRYRTIPCLDRNPCDQAPFSCRSPAMEEMPMDAIIYLVGLVVVVMALLSFFGIH